MDFTSLRLGQLPTAAISLTDNIAHEVGSDLRKATVQELADFVANYASTIQGAGFRPVNVIDGQTLPTTTTKEFILVGKGTYFNVNGGATIVLNEELNALVSNGTFWSIGVEIPVNVELAGIVQTIRSGYTTTTPSENTLFDALALKLNIADLPPPALTPPSIATGLSQGGVSTINTDNTKFDLSAGSGYVINGHSNVDLPIVQRVSWVAKIGNVVPNISSQKQTYVALDINGDLFLTPIPLTATERRNYIRIGVLIHSNNTIISYIDNQPTINIEVGGQVQDLLESLGFRSLSGNRILPVGTNLKIKKELGKAFKPGANFNVLSTQPHSFVLAAQDPITFRYRTQTGIELADTTDINPGIYDVNGTITAMPSTATFVSIQRIYIFQDGVIRIQPGQRSFVDMNTAVNNINSAPFITDNDIENNGLYLGAIAITRNNINLSTTTEVIFIPSQGTTVNGSFATPALGYNAEDVANKQNNLNTDGTGAKYPTVDAVKLALTTKADLVGGLVPANQLPSYVDDVLEFANLVSFPATGEIGKIYIALDSNKQYRWTGSAYIQITNGLIASTNDVPEGSNNLYFTAARVLANVLTGLSTASSAVISATDTVLLAFGKLQAQINGKAPSSGSANYIQNGTAQQTANLNISGTGVFASSVTATGGLFSGILEATGINKKAIVINGSVGVGTYEIGRNQSTGLLEFKGTEATFNGYLFKGPTIDLFTLSDTGAATFASSLTANSLAITTAPTTSTGTPPILTYNASNKAIESLPYSSIGSAFKRKQYISFSPNQSFAASSSWYTYPNGTTTNLSNTPMTTTTAIPTDQFATQSKQTLNSPIFSNSKVTNVFFSIESNTSPAVPMDLVIQVKRASTSFNKILARQTITLASGFLEGTFTAGNLDLTTALNPLDQIRLFINNGNLAVNAYDFTITLEITEN
ncbi:peptidase [Flavobacterium phage 11b]|uniref:peptidase n=1 Tax=Flavobacterium phage 11b TaxID=294631 RepID=UPI000044414C|nr:peptidase [Flavobacterium phage 11b]CAH56673.1 conserved hypothetical protein [Flavobacterium phage 11b]